MTKTPETTPSPTRSKADSSVGSSSNHNPSQSMLFVGMTLDMGWRLAVVVLVLIIIGSKLDDTLNTKPWLTLIALLAAVAGSFLVIKSMVKKADQAIRD